MAITPKTMEMRFPSPDDVRLRFDGTAVAEDNVLLPGSVAKAIVVDGAMM